MLLVRHGQSEWNALGRWQGRADPELSDLGREQAWSAAQRLGSVDVIVSSPLLRALGTATIISGSLGVGPVVVEPDLVERDAGEWSGLTRAQIDEAWPGYVAEGRRPPGFEPEDAMRARVLRALARIESEYRGGEVLVLTHGGVIYALEAVHDQPFERVPNLGARWLTHHGDRIALGERLVLVDDELVTTPAQPGQV
jgi:broad specificity phosphatase PhoE